jgi:hypothetical protein
MTLLLAAAALVPMMLRKEGLVLCANCAVLSWGAHNLLTRVLR